MRKIFTTLKSVVAATVIAAMALATSCSYDDTAIKKDVEQIKTDLAALTERVAALENELGEQVASLTELINGKVVVTDVETEGDTITVTLSDGSSFTIDNSKSTAVKGDDYTIGAYAEGGVYYWAVFKNGEFQNFLEVEGQKVAVFAEGCDCEETTPAEGCACDLKMEVREDGYLYVSIDGGVNWESTELPAQQVSGACVFTGVEVNGDVVTFTLADGSTFDIQKAELVEFEAAKSAIYVKTGETKSIAFAINDAVEDINVMNQPLGWKASVEAPTRAVGGMDYVLNITGPAKDFLQYAEKSGKISIHFNTAAGACKVMNIDVELAAIDLQVDKAGNITITTTVVDEYDKTDWYGETEHIVEFNNFYLAIFDLDQYNAINGDLEQVYNSSWGEFKIPAAAGYINNIFSNIGDNPYEGAKYVDGVNEKWTINATVESVLKNLDWYGQLPYEGNSFMVCVIPTDINANGAPVWAETIAVPFKQLSISIVENVDNRAFNNAYFDVTLRGAAAYYLYPVAKADIEEYIELGYADSDKGYFWSSLESYLQYPDWNSFGFKIESDVVEENIALSDLLAYTRDYYYFETKPATEYVMCLFVEEEGRTDYSIEDIRLYEFATADLVDAEPAFEVSYEMADDWSLYTIGVDLTVPESIVTVYSRWYDEELPAEDLQADLIDNGYAREPGDFEESGHTYYLGTNCDAPATTKYLGLLLIDAQGKSTVLSLPFASKELEMNDVDFSIESVAFTPEAVTVTLAGLDGLEVKNYKYYFIGVNGGSSYQKTKEECQDIAYSNNYLYKSTEAHPIIITSTADYKYSFSDGTYKLAVGVEFADGSFSKCVYGEYTYEQPAEELVSVAARYQESDPNWLAVDLTKDNGDVINTTFGNGGANYLEEGLWDFNRYYSDGFALGNTYVNGTTWVGNITVLVAYVDGKYDLTVNSSVGKYHYNGAIEGLVVPGAEEPEPEEPAEPALVEFTSVAVAAVDSNLNYHNLTFTDGTYTAIIKLCTRGTAEYCAGLYDQNGSFGDANTLYIGGYATDNTWNGAECWPVTMEVIDNGDGTATFNLDYAEYPSAVEHHGTYTGVLEGLTLVEREEPEQPEGVITYEIINVTTGYDQPGEKEMQFWYSATNAHVIDFKGMDNCTPGQPLKAGYYSSAEGTIDEGYSIFDYGTTNGVMSSVECTVTDNGNGSLTYDAKFVYNGQEYAFVYTSPAQEVEESGNTVELTSKSAGEQIGSYAFGCLLSDAEGNNQVKIAVDQYYSWDAATDFPKANAYATWQSSPSYISQGSHFSFVNKTLKVNGVTYANDAISNAKLTVVEATSITVEFTVDGEDYKFVYNAF